MLELDYQNSNNDVCSSLENVQIITSATVPALSHFIGKLKCTWHFQLLLHECQQRQLSSGPVPCESHNWVHLICTLLLWSSYFGVTRNSLKSLIRAKCQRVKCVGSSCVDGHWFKCLHLNPKLNNEPVGSLRLCSDINDKDTEKISLYTVIICICYFQSASFWEYSVLLEHFSIALKQLDHSFVKRRNWHCNCGVYVYI